VRRRATININVIIIIIIIVISIVIGDSVARGWRPLAPAVAVAAAHPALPHTAYVDTLYLPRRLI